MRMPYNLQAITRQEARFPGFWPQIPGNVMLCRTTVNEDKTRCCPDSQSGEGEKHGEGGGGAQNRDVFGTDVISALPHPLPSLHTPAFNFAAF